MAPAEMTLVQRVRALVNDPDLVAHERDPEVLSAVSACLADPAAIFRIEAHERAREAILSRSHLLRRLRKDSAECNGGKPFSDWSLAGMIVDHAHSAGWTFDEVAEAPVRATLMVERILASLPLERGHDFDDDEDIV